jgi:hypothetical protein
MEVCGQLHIPATLISLLTIGDTFHGNRCVGDWVGPKGRTGRFGESLARAERKVSCIEIRFLTHNNTVRIVGEEHDLV